MANKYTNFNGNNKQKNLLRLFVLQILISIYYKA